MKQGRGPQAGPLPRLFRRAAGAAALATLSACLLCPPAPAGAVTPAAETAVREARYLYASHGNAALAEQKLLGVIAAEPDHLEAYQLLADIYFETGRPDRVLEVTARGLERFPGNPDLLLTRGRLFLVEGRQEEADLIRERLEEVSPDSPQASWLTALGHFHRNEREAEIKVLEAALGPARPAPAPRLRELMIRELAAAFEGLGRIDEARGRFQEYVTLDPGDRGRVEDYLRFLLRNRVGADHLESYGRELAEGPPPSPEAYLYLGEGLLGLGRPAEAILAAADGIARGGHRGRLELLAARAGLALGHRDAALARAEMAEIAGVALKEVEEVRRAAAAVDPVPYRGPRISAEPLRVIVGTVEDGARVVTPITLGNAGEETLHLRNVWILRVPGRAVDVRFPAAEIPPGGRIEGEVIVEGQGGPAEFLGDINLLSDDLLEPRKIVTVEGRIGAPLEAVFEVAPAGPFEFGEVEPGSVVAREFAVRNAGTLPLRIREVRTNPAVTWEGLEEREIAPGGGQGMAVRWRVPEQEGRAVTVLTFHVEGTRTLVNQVLMSAVVTPSAARKETE